MRARTVRHDHRHTVFVAAWSHLKQHDIALIATTHIDVTIWRDRDDSGIFQPMCEKCDLEARGCLDLCNALRRHLHLRRFKNMHRPTHIRAIALLRVRWIANRNASDQKSKHDMTHFHLFYALSSEGSAGFSLASTSTSRTAVRGERSVDWSAVFTSA